MKQVRNIRGVGWKLCLLVLILTTWVMPLTAFASSNRESEKKVSLTVAYPVDGVSFRLYRTGDLAEDGSAALSGAFADYRVLLDTTDTEALTGAAAALASYGMRDELKPIAAAESENGQVQFGEVVEGLYLVVWDTHTDADGNVYTPQPFLITLPNLEMQDDNTYQWNYNVKAIAKYTKETRPESRTYRVHKIWADSQDTSGRPDEIRVQLLQNGKVYETATLHAANGWSYEWTNLNPSDTWQVAEETVPGNYKVTVTRESTTFLVTNTLTPSTPPGTPSNTPAPGNPDKLSKLPQTGLLWWPVPILILVGICTILAGVYIGRKRT